MKKYLATIGQHVRGGGHTFPIVHVAEWITAGTGEDAIGVAQTMAASDRFSLPLAGYEMKGYLIALTCIEEGNCEAVQIPR